VPENLNGDALTDRLERPKSTQVDLLDPTSTSTLYRLLRMIIKLITRRNSVTKIHGAKTRLERNSHFRVGIPWKWEITWCSSGSDIGIPLHRNMIEWKSNLIPADLYNTVSEIVFLC